MVHNNQTGNGIKNLYISPLAEEIIISFEENYLATEPASVGGMKTGTAGAAGYSGDDFEGDSYSF